MTPEEYDEKLFENVWETPHEHCMSHGGLCGLGESICLAAGGSSSNEEKALMSLERFRECKRAQR